MVWVSNTCSISLYLVSLNKSSKIISNNGKTILVGIGSEPISVNPKRLTFKENCIIGSNVGTKSELKLLIGLA